MLTPNHDQAKNKTASELINLLGTPNERLAWRSLDDDELIAPGDMVKDAVDGKYRLVTKAMPEGLMIGVSAGTVRASWGISAGLRARQ